MGRGGPARRGLTGPCPPAAAPLRLAMPSDLAKKKAAKKKEAAKARQRPRRAAEENGDAGTEPQEARPPEANGTALPGEGRPRRGAARPRRDSRAQPPGGARPVALRPVGSARSVRVPRAAGACWRAGAVRGCWCP